ncbi:MAG: RIO1 family regulatory kinase/ATPase domain-containing protein [Candidatus Thorarchaeota archaeon]
MGAPVEKFNPLKPSALSQKRDSVRASTGGKKLKISEVTLDDVRRDAIQFGLATNVIFQMKAGKEASIYLAEWKGHPIILKAFRFWNTSQASKERGVYAPTKMCALASKEHDMLSACFEAGMNVPTPIGRVGNYLTMRLIGEGIEPAPQLKDVQLENPEDALDTILDQYLIMYTQVNYVHGDLSGYNILWWDNKPWIIDMPQAYRVGPWADMKHVVMLLRRDIVNVLSYFKKHYGIRRDVDHIVQVFLDEYVPENLRNYEETFAIPEEALPNE